MRKMLIAAAIVSALWASHAQACRAPIYADATLYGMIISPPPNCMNCGRRFIVLDVQSNKPIRVIQLNPIALSCYSPNGEVGEIGTLNLKGLPNEKDLMQHSFLVGQKPVVSEQWHTRPKS